MSASDITIRSLRIRVVVGGDLDAGAADEPGDDQRRDRIEDRQAGAHARQRRDHRQRRPHVAAGLQGVGQQHLAAEALRLARTRSAPRTRLITTVTTMIDEAGDRDLRRRRPSAQMIEGVAEHLERRAGAGRPVTAAAATVSYLR